MVLADMTRDASVSKRDRGLDTRSMEEFAGFLMETGWLDTLEADPASMNSDKPRRPFEFTDKAMQWANRIRVAFKIGYRLAKEIYVAINIKSSQLNKKNMPDRPSRIVSHGSVARGRGMRRILEVGREEWKKEKGYGRRWKMECTFSDVKRLFGDIPRSRTCRTDAEETVAKAVLLNEYKGIRMRCQGTR